MPLERRIQIKIPKLRAAILHHQRRNDFQSFEQGGGFRAAVRLDVADDDINAFGEPIMRRLKHTVGLAHARRRAQENLEPPTMAAQIFVLDTRQ